MTVVSSLMVNFICLYIGKYLMHYVLRDPAAGFDGSEKYQATARLFKLFSKTNIHVGLILAVIVVIVGYLALYKSPWIHKGEDFEKCPICFTPADKFRKF